MKESSVKECCCKSFIVIDENGDEHEALGINEEDAVLKYARNSNEHNDYYLLNGSVEITVNGKSFCISAELDIKYSAKEI